ncbi:MAG: hypothetical protein ABIK92_21705 [Pseudomonadota bacterium]
MKTLLVLIVGLAVCFGAYAIDPEPPGGRICAPWCNVTGSSNGESFTISLSFGGVNPPHQNFASFTINEYDDTDSKIGEASCEWSSPSGSSLQFGWEDTTPGTAYVIVDGLYMCLHCNTMGIDHERIDM